MTNNIQLLYCRYKQEYPNHSLNDIVELMLDDGVITFDTAKKIKSGISLFLIDCFSEKTNAESNEFDITEIFGGNFNLRSKPTTKFNRRIEVTNQPMIQGDCWLLSDINSLNCTEWGKKAIYEAIIPDEDGSGGVTINFKGSPLKEKSIHITAYQIEQAKKSGNYSDGDDDMIAFELATEITFRKMVKEGLASRKENDKYIQSMGGNYRSFIFAGIKTDEFDQYPISELLGIKTKKVYTSYMNEQPTAKKDKDNLLKYVAQNESDISGWCAFSPFVNWGDENSKDRIHNGHAYAIRTVNYGKNVILSDPHYSGYEIKVPWKVFMEYVMDITFSFKDSEAEQDFKQRALPSNYEANLKKSQENFEKGKDEILQRMGLK